VAFFGPSCVISKFFTGRRTTRIVGMFRAAGTFTKLLCPDQVLHFLLCFVLISEIEFLPCVNLLGRRFGYTLVVDLRGMVKVDAVVVKRIVKAVDNPAGYT
jgi:hypothetical protein